MSGYSRTDARGSIREDLDHVLETWRYPPWPDRVPIQLPPSPKQPA
jgi:hypothetical protein